MAEFLEVLETIRAEEASTQRLFGGEGTRARDGARDPRYMAALTEAAELVADVYAGRRPLYRLQEAMATDDFPLLFGDVLDRQLLGSYREYPVQWQLIARRGTVRDFRQVKRFTVDGGEAVLDEVKQLDEYPAAALSEGQFTYSVAKHGRRLPFSWESFINDDLDALRSAPERLGKAARRSEERFATDLYVDSGGPDSTFFTGSNKITTELSTAGLQEGFTALASQTDPDGNPIFVEAVYLVVPPALEVTAQNILNALELRVAEADGTTVVAQNWMRNRLTPITNPWLPLIDTTSGSTAWYLFASPMSGRPAMEVGFLRGNEEPAVFVKEPNARRVGGGAVAPENGDFDTDSIDYKIRHVFGGTLMDNKMAVASDGTVAPS